MVTMLLMEDLPLKDNTAGLGRLVDIYIPDRKDRRGGNFGFARFKEAKNINSLLKSLDSIWFGSYKLRVSVANTSIVKNGKARAGDNPSLSPYNSKQPDNPTALLAEHKNKTFKEALLSNLPTSADRRRTAQTNIVIPVNEEDREWLRNCAVGTLRDLESMSSIQDFLWNFGLQCEIIPMGGFQVLIKSEDTVQISDFIDSEHDKWSCWFHSLKLWEPLAVSQERFTWVRIVGLPLHAWNIKSFKLLGDLVGKFVAADKDTENKCLMDKARVLVSVPSAASVDSSFKVMIDGLCLPISIIEEPGCVYRWWEAPAFEGVDSRSDYFSDCFIGNRSEESEEHWPASLKSDLKSHRLASTPNTKSVMAWHMTLSTHMTRMASMTILSAHMTRTAPFSTASSNKPITLLENVANNLWKAYAWAQQIPFPTPFPTL
ncbi:hypothetical protein REPUB_Repub18cG0084400 [Reevesia pubescens]